MMPADTGTPNRHDFVAYVALAGVGVLMVAQYIEVHAMRRAYEQTLEAYRQTAGLYAIMLDHVIGERGSDERRKAENEQAARRKTEDQEREPTGGVV